jgi:hypothetical protein
VCCKPTLSCDEDVPTSEDDRLDETTGLSEDMAVLTYRGHQVLYGLFSDLLPLPFLDNNVFERY